jgi:hypothetical protein
VGLPVLRAPQHQDPDVGGAWPIPDKEAARWILRALLEAAAETAAAEPALDGAAVERATAGAGPEAAA